MQRMTGIASGTECVRRECRHAFMVLAAALTPTMPVAAQCGDMELWPSGATELRAQPDSSIEPQADGSMLVRTGTQYRWPGARMEFRSGLCDLSAYGSIRIAVSNVSERALTVHLSVKGDLMQGESPGGGIRLAPRAAGELKVELCSMPCVLDAPLAFVGMRGYPKHTNGGAFDVRKTRSFHIFVLQDGKPAEFCVRRIVASCAAANTRILPAKILSAKTFMPFVDKFGQFAHDDWPGKVHDDGELAAARSQEEKWFKDHPGSPIPDADRFGGWAKGPQLKATGHFRTEKVDGKWWLVDPDGHLFFSHGVCVVKLANGTGVSFREKYFSWLPEKDDPDFGGFWRRTSWKAANGFYSDPAHLPYDVFDFAQANGRRKYGPDWKRTYSDIVHARLKAWGLNTIACFSDAEIYRLDRTPYTVSIWMLGSWPVIEGSRGWWGKLGDPFASKFAKIVKERVAWELKKIGDDPWCIGCFVDNELSWGSDDVEIGRAVLRSPAGQPAKVAARAMLEKKYGSVAALDAAWGTEYRSWEKFLSVTNLPSSEKRCEQDLKEIHRSVAALYFRTVSDAIKAAAPYMLYLGSRIAWGGDSVYEECARYCDVVSVNIYKRRPERDLPPGAPDKPMIIGEFHFGALDRGVFHTGLVPTRDQNERAACYRDYVNACIDHPRYVGAHWFQWQDQILTGRGDGENFQIGFVTIADTPYPELVQAARDIGSTMYRRRYMGEGRASAR